MALTPFGGFGLGLWDPFMSSSGRVRDPLDFGSLLPSLSAAAPAMSMHPM